MGERVLQEQPAAKALRKQVKSVMLSEGATVEPSQLAWHGARRRERGPRVRLGPHTCGAHERARHEGEPRGRTAGDIHEASPPNCGHPVMACIPAQCPVSGE